MSLSMPIALKLPRGTTIAPYQPEEVRDNCECQCPRYVLPTIGLVIPPKIFSFRRLLGGAAPCTSGLTFHSSLLDKDGCDGELGDLVLAAPGKDMSIFSAGKLGL